MLNGSDFESGAITGLSWKRTEVEIEPNWGKIAFLVTIEQEALTIEITSKVTISTSF